MPSSALLSHSNFSLTSYLVRVLSLISSLQNTPTTKMRFAFTGALTLAVAAAALPTEHSSGHKADLTHLQQKCGDLTISCCTQVVVEGNGSSGSSIDIQGMLGTVISTLTSISSSSNAVCGAPGLAIGSVIGTITGVSRMFPSLFLLSLSCLLWSRNKYER